MLVSRLAAGRPARIGRPPLPRSTCLVFGVLAIYWSLFIANTSFVLGDTRYFTLLDDAMISMRYASNVAAGHGLVWNPGEPPIEGYTNPLWVLFMVVCHWLPVARAKVSLLVQLAGAACLLLTTYFGLRVMTAVGRFELRSLDVAACSLLTGTYVALTNWALQGSEVAILAACWTAATALALESNARGAFSSAVYWLGATAILVRPDGVVAFVPIVLWLTWRQPQHRRAHLLSIAVALGGAVAGQALVRWLAFGELLPNTYYLKLEGYPAAWRLASGLWHYLRVLGELALVLAFAAGAWLTGARLTHLPLAVWCAASMYSVYVGGDAWEWWGGTNRYLSPAVPVLLSYSWAAFRTLWSWARLPTPWSIAVMLVMLLSINSVNGVGGLRVLALVDPPLHAADNRMTTALGLAIRDCTDRQATLAVDWAGVLPYFAERRTVDMLGKSDAHIARLPMHIDESLPVHRRFWPGHLKWDLDHSIGRLQPDVVVVLTGPLVPTFLSYLAPSSAIISRLIYSGFVAVPKTSDTVDPRLLSACLEGRMEQLDSRRMWQFGRALGESRRLSRAP